MKCPKCRAWTYVLEVRGNKAGKYRRYECANGHRFSTQEIPADDSKVVDAPVTPRRDPKGRYFSS